MDHALRALDPPPVHLDLVLQIMPGRVDPHDWRFPQDSPDGSTITIQQRPRWARGRGFGTTYLLNSHYYFPRRVSKGYDRYHFSSQMMGAGVRSAAPAIITLHDLIALRLGTNHPVVSTWLRRRHFPHLRRARGLIIASEYSRQDCLSAYEYTEARTSPVSHAASPGFAPVDRIASREALGLEPERPVILHVGGEERRKNVETLLDAIALLVGARPDLLLLWVGAPSSLSHARIARHGLEGHVRCCLGLTDDQFVAAYSASDLFVFPSYFEGFRFPVLEAMEAGCPVITARATSVPEVTGDAAVLVEPMDAAALANTIGALLDDPARRDFLGAHGQSILVVPAEGEQASYSRTRVTCPTSPNSTRKSSTSSSSSDLSAWASASSRSW